MEKRGSGILLHITSLPSPYGIGDLGPGAYSFADFLAGAKQSFWQILPLNPTSISYGNSPYSSFSAFAGNSLLISPELMIEDGFLKKNDVESSAGFPVNRVDYKLTTRYKDKILNRVYETNKKKIKGNSEFRQFCRENSFWLDDYSLFMSLKRYFKKFDWSRWPEDLRDRKEDAVKKWRGKLNGEISKETFFQYIFFKQWKALKNYCSGKNIQIIGDVPMYVNYDSSDVWTNPEIFSLNENKMPVFIAGVPPDYFSSTGQLWGHPVYNWDVLKKNSYSWWIKRIEHNINLYYIFRLDHFRGFVGYWEVPAGEKTAVNGRWVKAPAEDFFKALFNRFSRLPLIAEDLGVITPDVKAVMNQFGFPGMKVLLFAFEDDFPTNPYAPHNHIKNCVVYTGTHDNNTIKGWFKRELNSDSKKRLSEYLGREVSNKTVHWELIRIAMESVADMAIVPMQDILGLGEKARMNLPASSKGNWQWRVTKRQLSPALIKKLRDMTAIAGRDD